MINAIQASRREFPMILLKGQTAITPIDMVFYVPYGDSNLHDTSRPDQQCAKPLS